MSLHRDCVPNTLVDLESAAPFACRVGSIDEPQRHEFTTDFLESPGLRITALDPSLEDREPKLPLAPEEDRIQVAMQKIHNASLPAEIALETMSFLPWTGPSIFTAGAPEIFQGVRDMAGIDGWIGFLEFKIITYNSQHRELSRKQFFLPETDADFVLVGLRAEMSAWVQPDFCPVCRVLMRVRQDLNYAFNTTISSASGKGKFGA